jgi:drug/metabolite transporter (DMT)-like permease
MNELHVRSLYTWGFILAVVLFSSAGDVLLAKGMTRIGDLGQLFKTRGLFAVVRAVFGSTFFLLGVTCMAGGFFSLLIAFSWADLSLVAPASASLTFVASALLAKFFLHENVDRRRWIAVAFVCVGVFLLAL